MTAMDIEFGPALDEFRAEMRGWIERNRQPALLGLDAHALWAGDHATDGAVTDAYRAWEAASLQANLVCPRWDSEYGGRGLSELELAIFEEELDRAAMPRVIRYMSEYLVGPTVIAHGTAEQKAYFLPRIIDGTDRYCQGFSEPDHGSDLAAVQTRAVVAGHEIVISGHKLWTSDAANSNMIFILCRTNPDVPKHKGLSFVLTPLTDNNITVRPLVQMSGLSGFCEEFIDDARAPLFNVIGGIDNGWAVAMTTLSSERGGLAISLHLTFHAELMELVAALRDAGKLEDPVVRQHVAWMYTHVQLMRYGGVRILGSMLRPTQDAPHPSVSKLFWSEYHKRFGELAMTLLGPTAMLRPNGDGYPITRWQSVFLSSRSETILSGTSEIQRRIIGDRVLGLPRDA
jgi:alkylation response protein AidB-like acyl-CoA dehydrogenase